LVVRPVAGSLSADIDADGDVTGLRRAGGRFCPTSPYCR
jgi:hypothetical protein